MKKFLASLTVLALLAVPVLACNHVGLSYGSYSYGQTYSFALPFMPTVNYCVPPPQLVYAAPAPVYAAPAPVQTYQAPAPVQEFRQTYQAPPTVYAEPPQVFAAPAPVYPCPVRTRAFLGSYGYGYGAGVRVENFRQRDFRHVAGARVEVFGSGRHGLLPRRGFAAAPAQPRKIVTKTRTVTRIK